MPPDSNKKSVLPHGVVESRGFGVANSTKERVQHEINEFLNGEAKLSVKAETRAFFTVWSFITRLPAPAWVELHPGFLMRGAGYFPLAGGLIGILVASFFDAAIALGLPAAVAACISTSASLWITGCFHEDGLADSGDAIGGGWSRRQILTIMQDVHLGTYGCAVLMLYVSAKLQFLSLLGASDWELSSGAGPALIASHTVARLVAPFMIHTRDYVDEQGPKSQFYSFMIQAKQLVSWHRVLFGVLTSSVVTSYFYGSFHAAILVGVVLVVAECAGRYGDFLLGGVVGDFLGATICLTELLIYAIIYLLSNNSYIPQTWEDASKFVLEHHQNTVELFREYAFKPNHPIGALLRFMLTMIVLFIWCSFVGHPNVFIEETAKEERKNGTKQKSLECKAREKAESICSSLESTFRERYDAARDYLDALAKPVGSLGTLEDWAARLAALQQTTHIVVDSVVCLIFAADHGAAADLSAGGESCSSFPQAVTKSVLEGLDRGIAGASVLAKHNGVTDLQVVDVGVCAASFGDEADFNKTVVSSTDKLKGGTRNMCTGPAMTEEEVERCVKIGSKKLSEFVSRTAAKAVVLGEVGIGNTSSSSALISHLARVPVENVSGGGATMSRVVEKESIAKKVKIVTKALSKHQNIEGPMDALAKIGGAEIAALVGAILEASNQSIPILIDGLIVTAAALVAAMISPNACRIMFLSTKSAEPGQIAAVARIQELAEANNVIVPASPALDMGLRMGEATGGLLAVPLLRSAAAIMNDMGTIAEILESPNVSSDG